MKFRILYLLCFCPSFILGQDFKWDKTLDVFVSPSISTSILGSVTPDEKGGFSSNQLIDSFKKSDVSNVKKKNGKHARSQYHFLKGKNPTKSWLFFKPQQSLINHGCL